MLPLQDHTTQEVHSLWEAMVTFNTAFPCNSTMAARYEDAAAEAIIILTATKLKPHNGLVSGGHSQRIPSFQDSCINVVTN